MANRVAAFCDGPCGLPEPAVELAPYTAITPDGMVAVMLCEADSAMFKAIRDAYAEHFTEGVFYGARRRDKTRTIEHLDDLVR